MRIQVKCYAGYRGEETPRQLQIRGGQWEEVKVLDRWLAPQHRYFKVESGGGAQWIIRHDTLADEWTLHHYKLI
jgi:hypothetical protein